LLLDKTDTGTEARVKNPCNNQSRYPIRGSDHGQLMLCNIQAILSTSVTDLAIQSFECP